MIYSSELVKGTLRTIILRLLSDNKKMYGYEMTQKVKELTGDRIQITEGALYPSLHALLHERLVTAETEYIGKRVRKYYKLTANGKRQAKIRVSELKDFMETMKFLINVKTQPG